jgi:phage baseplate assembly protein V
MSERAIQKLLAPLARRLQNFMARGTVLRSDAGKKMQQLQVRLLADEVADGLEHFEPFGFTSRPKPGAEHVTLFVDGDRSHGITIVVADRRYRLQGLEEGEVALHDDQGQKVHLTRNGIVVDGGGKAITFQNAPTVTFNVGAIVFDGAATVTHGGKNIGRTHTHSGVQVGAGNTGQPV